MSVLEKLTEGIVNRDLKKEGAALLSKWEKTGLLEGLGGENQKHTMSRLLENQAKELLREASTMAAGDVEGFAAVAFPIVRRVFGGLIANDLVSVQPMSLPSGLIFFLDFTFSNATMQSDYKLGAQANTSLYGGGRVGSELTGGVLLTGENPGVGAVNNGQLQRAEMGFYALNNGYASPTGSQTGNWVMIGSGTVGENWLGAGHHSAYTASSVTFSDGTVGAFTLERAVEFDPDLQGVNVVVGTFDTSTIEPSGQPWNRTDLVAIRATTGVPGAADETVSQIRRLTRFDPISGSTKILGVFAATASAQTAVALSNEAEGCSTFTYPMKDTFSGSAAAAAGSTNAIGTVVGQPEWGLENNPNIPEIDLKVQSVSVTAVTKKLKAKWTPELGQDLNAYHNLDAEVELTSILSEQIALEIDREILEDLVRGATAATYYWSRSPGLFVNRVTGAEIGASSAAPDFTGTVSEWYETLIETINDVSAQVHRKTLRGGANFIVTSPEVANIMEFTAGFRASVTHDDTKGVAGAEKVGSLSKKFDIYVDPYFPRNLVLVGRKGNSFLESGYVYSPYVPLQVTPTIFGTEDFVPRKGVMTRYAKKMVRPDMYGLVIVRGLIGESGAQLK